MTKSSENVRQHPPIAAPLNRLMCPLNPVTDERFHTRKSFDEKN